MPQYAIVNQTDLKDGINYDVILKDDSGNQENQTYFVSDKSEASQVLSKAAWNLQNGLIAESAALPDPQESLSEPIFIDALPENQIV